MDDVAQLAGQSATFQLQAARTEQNLSAANRSTNAQVGDSEADLEKASQQFEALLLNIMIKEMRATVPESELFPASMADEIFTSMLDEQYADVMARGGGIGLSRLVVDQLSTREPLSEDTDPVSGKPVKLK